MIDVQIHILKHSVAVEEIKSTEIVITSIYHLRFGASGPSAPYDGATRARRPRGRVGRQGAPVGHQFGVLSHPSHG